MNAAERVIVALDGTEEEAHALVHKLAGRLTWVKVGMILYYATGPRIVQELKEQGLKVFVDLKLHDIPNTVRGGVASVVAAGADMFTVHAAGGREMLRAAALGAKEGLDALSLPADSARDIPIGLAVTVLTSLDETSLGEVGVERPLREQVDALALLAQDAGLAGVVASPQEARGLRALLGSQAAIVTPGIRPRGASQDDQSRIATPTQALQDGASHLVIGRPITAAPSPVHAFESILEEIERGVS